MPMSPAQLCQFQPGLAEAVYYTVLPGGLAIVTNIIIANPTAGSVSISLSVVPVGQTGGNANRIIPGVLVAPNQVVPFDLATVMPSGYMLSASASVAAALAVTISGVVR